MYDMRLRAIAVVLLILLLSACSAPSSADAHEISCERSITDSLGNTAAIPEDPRIVSLYGSYAQCWLLSGGELVGVTSDAVEEHGIETGEDIALVGTVKEPNIELVTALSPDYVILSADLTQHTSLDSLLNELNIPHGYFRMDTFEDYSSIMQSFCDLNDSAGKLFEENVSSVKAKIDSIVSEAEKALSDSAPHVLLLRAYSTGVKAKSDDNLAGVILNELGAHNIADDSPSLLEDLSIEAIAEADPDFIFVTTMGNADSAKSYMSDMIESNPIWSELTAVKNSRYIFLPKELFHYKPLNRWDESYAYLADCLLEKN